MFVFVLLKRYGAVVFNSTCSTTFLVSAVVAFKKLRSVENPFEKRWEIQIVSVIAIKVFIKAF